VPFIYATVNVIVIIIIKDFINKISIMTKGLFLLQSHKFSTDNIEGTLVCSQCDEIFTKQFPLDLEGQTIEFRCPVCNFAGEADIPYKPVEEREELDEDLTELEQEDLEQLDENY
jgi:hypothetical protein